ncbi:hypothetical protein [uncultured Draconibacterium sp.]|uniref:hypothetical protein n=1 Tax=uncultured Draconibacterium sp. TaxID=1573823 RepID=UPI003260ED1E
MSTKQQLLSALEAEQAGDWDKAHEIVQAMQDKQAFWIHAYLHRKEPDVGNAAYWYQQANKPFPHCSYDEEWQAIFNHIKKLKE